MNKKIKINKELFFYIGLVIQIFYVVRIITINSYENSEVYIVLIILCSLLSIFLSRFNKRELLIFLCLFLCSCIHLFKTEDANLLRIILLVFSAKGIDVNRLKKFLAIAYPVVFFGVWIFSQFYGFNDVIQEGVWRISAGWETRYSLGFDGPTRMMFIWLCCIVSIQLLIQKTNIIRDLLFLGFSIYLFTISVSYTGIISSVIGIAMPYICGFVVKHGKSFILKYFVYGSLFIVLVLTVLATLIDISKTSLGLWLNGRTYFLHHLLASGVYPSLFGANFQINVMGLDNSYYYNLYLMGIVPMIFMVLSIIKLGKLYCINKDIMGVSSTVTFILVAYVTQTLEYPFLNYFLFLIIENWSCMMRPMRQWKKYSDAEMKSIKNQA